MAKALSPQPSSRRGTSLRPSTSQFLRGYGAWTTSASPSDQIVLRSDRTHGERRRSIFGLRIAFVNVFGVQNPSGSWAFIDAGVPGSAPYIRSLDERTFDKPPCALVLTHGHFDRVGAARTLAGEWRIPVYAHPLEFPCLTGKQSCGARLHAKARRVL